MDRQSIDRTIDLAMSHLEERFGELESRARPREDQFLHSGWDQLDTVLGGGFLRGRVVEVFGPPSSGKTTLALALAAAVQRAGGVAALLDMERSMDRVYAASLGVRNEELLIGTPYSAEEAYETVDYITRSGHVDLVVIDSSTTMVPLAELESRMRDVNLGLHERLTAHALHKLVPVLAHHDSTLLVLSQVRSHMGQFRRGEGSASGAAITHHAAQRLSIESAGRNSAGSFGCSIAVSKNEVSPPGVEVTVTIKRTVEGG